MENPEPNQDSGFFIFKCKMMYETIRVGDSEIKADVEEMRIHHFIFEGFPKLIVQLHCVTLLPSMMKEQRITRLRGDGLFSMISPQPFVPPLFR